MATAKATQQTSEADLNKLNGAMRGMPWYQQFFKERGLDPNKVKLSGQQREALSGLAAQNGYQLGSRMKFDEAGNINQSGGFAGMPTWAKIAIAAAPVVATAGFGAAGMGPMAGLLSSTAPVAVPTIGSTALTTGMGVAPSIAGAATMTGVGGAVAGAGGTAAAAAPSLMSRIAGMAGAGGRMVAQAGQASATNRGAEIETRLAHDQLNLTAERERRAAEADAFRKSLYGQIASGYQPSTRPAGVTSRTPVDAFVTPQAREAGQLMTDTAMARMKSGDYGTNITPYSQLPTKPGLMERIANYAGPAMTLFDPRLYDRTGQQANG